MRDTETLIRLQQTDLKIIQQKRKLQNMPQTKKLAAVVAARKKLAPQILKIMGQRKDAQMELDENDSLRTSLANEVAEIQHRSHTAALGYRELRDLENQLASLIKRIEKLDFKRPSLVTSLEKAQVAERNAQAMDERLTREGAALMDALKRDTATLREEVDRLSSERARLAADLDLEVLRRYENAVRRFDGLAVETLRGNKPSVCCVAIPPSSYGDVMRGARITECPYCHRLLVVDTDAASEE